MTLLMYRTAGAGIDMVGRPRLEVAGNLQFRGVFVADGERGRRYAVYFNRGITNADG